MLNDQQKIAVEKWDSGLNVKITAVPGAGKSKVLIEACKQFTKGIIIILAYNHDLCEETRKKINQEHLEDRVICMTFHGLATYCIMPTYDDTALFDALEGVEGGEIEVQNKISVSAVLIDEAQDFRHSFKRLLNLVLDLQDDVQYMVVGDSNQMLYTYDDEDPADLDFLSNPQSHFHSMRAWDHVEFYKTHRLTPPMANVVSRIFNINLKSAKENELEKFLPVQLYTLKLWKSGALLHQMIKNVNWEDVVVLVPKKKNNGPLRAALNYLSSQGVKIYLHGNDGQDERVRINKLCVSTWHSSKGTEKKIVIVLGISSESEKNPLFVALTRGMHQLIVIQDEDNPHIDLMHSLNYLGPEDILFCESTKRLKNNGFKPKDRYQFNIAESITYSLDNFRPKGTARWIRNYQDVEIIHKLRDEEELDDIVQLTDIHEDVSTIYALACCMAIEYEFTNKVRLLEDIRAPLRLTRDKQNAAILSDHNSRFVSPNVPLNTLIGEDMVEILKVYHEKHQISPIQWCELACVAKSWNDFHHTMRQLKPFTWFDNTKFYQGCSNLRNQFQNFSPEFDVRVKCLSPNYSNTVFYARVHAISKDGIFYLIWDSEISHSHRISATIRASLNSKRPVAYIINIPLNTIEKIIVKNPTELLSKLL